MIDREGRLGRRIGNWAVWSARHPRIVVALGSCFAVAAAWYGYTHLYVDADTGNLVSDRLPWRQAHEALDRSFPHLLEEMQVVIDAASPEIAAEAQRRLAEALEARTDVFSVVYAPGDGDFFDRHALLYSTTDELAELRSRMRDYRQMWLDLEKDPTLGGLAAVVERVGADSTRQTDVSPVLMAIGGAFYANRYGHFFTFPWSDLTQGRSSDRSERRRFVLVKPILDYSRSRPAAAAMQAIRDGADKLGLDRRAVRVRITGSEAFEHESIDAGLKDVPRLLIGALVMVALVLYAAMRSVRLLGASLCVLTAGLAGTAAFAAVAVGGLNMISVAFAILYVGLGIDYSIHFCLHYVEARQETGSHIEALRATSERAGVPLFLSAVTTALCFYAFMVTDFTGVADLGKIGGTGMLFSFAATVGLLPALLSLGPFRLPETEEAEGTDVGVPIAPTRTPLTWLDGVVTRRRRLILLAALVLAAISATLIPRARFDQDVINMSDPDAESVLTLRELLGDPNTAVRAVSMLEPDSARAADVAARLAGLDVVRSTMTLSTFVPSDQEAKLEIIQGLAADLGPRTDSRNAPATGADAGAAYERRMAAVQRLQDAATELSLDGDSATRAAARQLAFLIGLWRSHQRIWLPETQASMAAGLEKSLVGTLPWVQTRFRRALHAGPVTRQGLPGALRERWVTPAGIERVQVLPADRLDTPQKLRGFVEAVQAEEPAISGMPVENVELGKVTVRAFRMAFALALVATAAALLVLLGDPRSSAIVMASLILATLFTGAVASWWDIPFNISNVITLPLLLGIGVDAGIHIVHRRRQTGDGERLLDTATGRAIFYSGLTTIVGFGNLMLATHRAIAGMGALLVIGMINVLICTLVVLPAVMARPARRA